MRRDVPAHLLDQLRGRRVFHPGIYDRHGERFPRQKCQGILCGGAGKGLVERGGEYAFDHHMREAGIGVNDKNALEHWSLSTHGIGRRGQGVFIRIIRPLQRIVNAGGDFRLGVCPRGPPALPACLSPHAEIRKGTVHP